MENPVRPTISVALCTYNGETYLPAQWQSLLDQHLLPDEIVVCDDRSTDGTVALLERLAAEAPFRVRILVNDVQLGSNKNFERALSECTGDLIFICDQDDYWFPNKISVMTDYMEKHPNDQLAFSDAWVTDEHLQGRERRFWTWIRFDEEAQNRWRTGEMMEVMLDGNRVMGCATVVRRSFLNRVMPFPDEVPGYIYDGWLGLVGAAYNAIQFVDEPLLLYRTHVRQQVGVRQKEPPQRVRLRDRFSRHRAIKLAPLREKQATLATISRLLAERVPQEAPGLTLLRRRLSHFTMRSCLPHDRLRRLKPVLNSLQQGNYNRYADAAANWYAPYLAALGDVLE
ncbi:MULTISPECIES: glycosyltransferase family 2 protein [Spirosoma]|uniref:Glycosyltransferase family 2 protein n=1 Tax=Spirosoma liriopis TaxID=2937440 RepID=A0ABT0HFK6_9BACT|nr:MULTISPECIES: glycosyltransferase family 2 protein [Spirosoma]MCK8490934.1 glycosyltransferase family 2 protein [Spirosoma liriopis]UHG90319.1 glycosyltransferase family 2 protein [Spirosoma oryzicola]